MNEVYKQVCPGLYFVEYDDFDFDKAAEWANKRFFPEGPFCSAVRKGRYAGRNMDILSEFKAAVIMLMKSSCARFSSLNTSEISLFPAIQDAIESQERKDVYYKLPQMTYDGINEKGVTAISLMTSNGNASEDKSKWGGREWGKSAAFTKPDALKTYSTTLLVRYVLDNAANVDEAIELIKQVNWFDPDRFTWRNHAGALKWLISDPKKSAVVEFIDNEIKILLTDDVNRPSLRTLAANFSQYLMEKGIVQYDATGYERFDLMCDLYKNVDDSIDGIQSVLRSVMMSEKHKRNISDKYFFATEYMWDESPTGRHFNAEEIYQGNARHDPDFIKIVELEKERHYNKSLRPKNYRTHVTVYTTVYDIAEKKLWILLNEGVSDSKWYEFEFLNK